MKIELRNIKRAAFASEETECFEATVYIDGAKAGTASNEGHGGPNMYHPTSLWQTLSEHAKTLARVTSNMVNKDDPSGFFTYDPDADHIIGELLTAWLVEKDLKRALSGKVLFTKADGRIYETKRVGADTVAKWLAPTEVEKTRTRPCCSTPCLSPRRLRSIVALPSLRPLPVA